MSQDRTLTKMDRLKAALKIAWDAKAAHTKMRQSVADLQETIRTAKDSVPPYYESFEEIEKIATQIESLELAYKLTHEPLIVKRDARRAAVDDVADLLPWKKWLKVGDVCYRKTSTHVVEYATPDSVDRYNGTYTMDTHSKPL